MTHRRFSWLLIVAGGFTLWYPYLLWPGVSMVGIGLLVLFFGWLKPPTLYRES